MPLMAAYSISRWSLWVITLSRTKEKTSRILSGICQMVSMSRYSNSRVELPTVTRTFPSPRLEFAWPQSGAGVAAAVPGSRRGP